MRRSYTRLRARIVAVAGVFLASAALVLLASGALSGREATNTVVDRPDVDSQNSHYVSNLPPLKPSAFIKLPVGSIKPAGWLLEFLKRQRSGLTGELGNISAWLQKDGNAWLDPKGEGEWGWEELPYWLKGYANIGYILSDRELIAESRIWIEGVLGSQRPDGDFGPAHGSGPTRDYWGNMIMLYCLQSYYEYSSDPRVLDLMAKYFKFQLTVPDEHFLNGYWQKVRGGDNLHSVFWLYNRTGEKWILELAAKIHRNTSDWTSRGHSLDAIKGRKQKRSGIEWPTWFGDLIDWHNVNIAQAFREPAQYYLLSGDPRDLRATYDNFRIVREAFGQVPGGMFGADENARPGYDDPRQGIETCGIVEQLNSDEHLLRITGDPFWADHAEEVAFNTYPAAVAPDFRSLRYLTAPNMVLSDAKSHWPGIDNRGPFLIMNPFSSRCCQHNHTQGWPYYAENAWLATPDNGVVAALYVAGEVSAKVGGEGGQVTIREVTNYPFEERVVFHIVAGGGTFPLYLRVPRWCEAAALSINGDRVAVEAPPSKYLRIERLWRRGDEVMLSLPMRLALRTWTENHNSVSLSRGPLTYSLKIKENYIVRQSDETAIGDSRWQKGADTRAWPSYEIHPSSAWNYGLLLTDEPLESQFTIERRPWPENNFPFTQEDVPISIAAAAKLIPEWTLGEDGLCGELQDSPVKSSQPTATVKLIPMGAARLRISAFPVIGSGADAKSWKPTPRAVQNFTASASHTFSGDTVRAIADGREPANSADHEIPRHTFWDHKGTKEWLQATFAGPVTVSSTAIYWFDDTGIGQCRVPDSWTLSYLDGDEWKLVRPPSQYGTAKDRFNKVSFEPVTTTGFRVNVELQAGFSAGVLEWRFTSSQPGPGED